MPVVEISDEDLAQEKARALHYFDNAVMKRVLARLERVESELLGAKMLQSGKGCGRCDNCIDGLQCNVAPNEQQLLERLERSEQAFITSQEQLFAWQVALHEVVPSFYYHATSASTLTPGDVRTVFEVLLEERDRVYALILSQERGGPDGSCLWCEHPTEHKALCPMFEADGVIRFGKPPS